MTPVTKHLLTTLDRGKSNKLKYQWKAKKKTKRFIEQSEQIEQGILDEKEQKKDLMYGSGIALKAENDNSTNSEKNIPSKKK